MDKGLRHELRQRVHILDLFRCDVFTLSKFKNIFFPVDNFDSVSIGHDECNISSVEPSIFVNSFVRQVLSQVVPLEDQGSSETKLSSRLRPSLFVFVSHQVLHFRHTFKFDFQVGHWASAVSNHGVPLVSPSSRPAVFGLPVDLEKWRRSSQRYELEYIRTDGGCCGD